MLRRTQEAQLQFKGVSLHQNREPERPLVSIERLLYSVHRSLPQNPENTRFFKGLPVGEAGSLVTYREAPEPDVLRPK